MRADTFGGRRVIAYRGLVVVVVVVVVEKGDTHIHRGTGREPRARRVDVVLEAGGRGGTAESVPGIVGGRAKARRRREAGAPDAE